VDYEIFFNDVFDKEFISNNLNRFNVVFSNGFVEHFDNLKDLIDLHKKLTSKGGLLVISIPNLRYLNSFLVSDKTKSIHNLEIMDLDFIRNNLPDGLEIKYLNYCGGLFNVGLFHYKNKFLEIIRSGCFLVQRLIFDPLFILLLKFGISFNWKYSSPAIVLICSKK